MELDIHSEVTENGGRFYADLDTENQAEITYKNFRPELRICDHTGVPDAYSGKGAAFALLNALIDDARETGVKYVALCPYVAVQFKRHPEWSDVFVTI